MSHTFSCPFIFFGTSRLSVLVLETLAQHGIVPQAIITTPDSPQGRKLILTPTDTKVYGTTHNIPVYTYEKLDQQAINEIKAMSAEFFLVASYGLIIPQAILDIPRCGAINIHPSLLPQYRGATPIQQAILDNCANTGITIMKMDAKMDHGPIYIQEKRKDPQDWPKPYSDLELELAQQSAHCFAAHIESICDQTLLPVDQIHDSATFTKKIIKSQGCIDLARLSGEDGYTQYLKYLAFDIWPGTYFFVKKKEQDIRVKIKSAHWDSERSLMYIDVVIPEGQKEVSFDEFMRRVSEYY